MRAIYLIFTAIFSYLIFLGFGKPVALLIEFVPERVPNSKGDTGASNRAERLGKMQIF